MSRGGGSLHERIIPAERPASVHSEWEFWVLMGYAVALAVFGRVCRSGVHGSDRVRRPLVCRFEPGLIRRAAVVGGDIFGWRRLAPWAHFWTGVPIVLAGIFGSTSVAAANAWMTAPSGFRLNAERPRSGPSAEVHARQAGRVARVDVEAEFLGHLTPASVPGRLPVGLQDAAGNRPAGLVGGLEDQSACPIEDERARGHRDGRETDGIRGGLVPLETVVGGHGPDGTARTAGVDLPLDPARSCAPEWRPRGRGCEPAEPAEPAEPGALLRWVSVIRRRRRGAVIRRRRRGALREPARPAAGEGRCVAGRRTRATSSRVRPASGRRHRRTDGATSSLPTVCTATLSTQSAVERGVRRSRRGQKTVVQSFLMLMTVHPSALARPSACSAPVV